MITKSHAEMNSEHYRYLRDNPEYRMEFILDVMREEMSYSLPWSPPGQPEPIRDAPRQPRMTPKEFTDRLHHLEVLNNDLMNRLNLHIDNSKRKRGKY